MNSLNRPSGREDVFSTGRHVLDALKILARTRSRSVALSNGSLDCRPPSGKLRKPASAIAASCPMRQAVILIGFERLEGLSGHICRLNTGAGSVKQVALNARLSWM